MAALSWERDSYGWWSGPYSVALQPCGSSYRATYLGRRGVESLGCFDDEHDAMSRCERHAADVLG